MTEQKDDTALIREYIENRISIPPGEYVVRETIVLNDRQCLICQDIMTGPFHSCAGSVPTGNL